MRGDFGVTSLAIILGIIMAVISLNFVFFDKRFRLLWAGCIVLLCACLMSFWSWEASYWGRWGEECLGLDVIISCDNYHFLYVLGWWLFEGGFIFFTVAVLACLTLALVSIITTIARFFAGWRR